MRVLVLGEGATARLVMSQAIGHGHDVTVFARAEAGDTAGRRPRLVTGAFSDASAVAEAVEGQRAVVLCLEPSSAGSTHDAADAAATVVRAMTARGVRRLVALSSFGVGASRGALPLSARALLLVACSREARDDLEHMEGDIMLSDLEWTIVRAARLTNGPQRGRYRVVDGAPVPGGTRIARADAAALLLKCAETSLYTRRIEYAAY